MDLLTLGHGTLAQAALACLPVPLLAGVRALLRYDGEAA